MALATLTNRRPERNINLLNVEVYFRKVVGRRRMMVERSLMLGLACSRPGGKKLSTLRSLHISIFLFKKIRRMVRRRAVLAPRLR